MATSSKPQPEATTAYLPSSAYFNTGGGPACDALRRALTSAGFTTVTGPTDGTKCGEFWITPPGGARTELSPPGTAPRQQYDIESVIQLVGTQSR